MPEDTVLNEVDDAKVASPDAIPATDSAETESNDTESKVNKVESSDPEEADVSEENEKKSLVDSLIKKDKKKKKKKLSKEEQLTERIIELEAQLEEKELEIKTQQESVEEAKEKTLRAHAELENFKRRKEQETEEFKKYSNEKLVLELLPILDSFDRAVDHASEDTVKDADFIKETISGFMLIQKQFHQVLEKMGVQKIEALNQIFDPNLHQAVAQELAEAVEPETVIKEYQAGYKLHERLIRPAMVVVAN